MRILLTLVTTALLLPTSVAQAKCPDGGTARAQLESISENFTAPITTTEKRDQLRDKLTAYSVLVWEAFGSQDLMGDYLVAVGVSNCYRKYGQDCGVPKDEVIAKQLQTAHVKAYNTGQAVGVRNVIPERPPAAMLQWAKNVIGGSCANSATRMASGRSVDVVQPSQPSAYTSSTQYSSSQVSSEPHPSDMVSTYVGLGNIGKLLSPEVSPYVSDRDLARGLENYMKKQSNQKGSSGDYGLGQYDVGRLQRVAPLMDSWNQLVFKNQLMKFGRSSPTRSASSASAPTSNIEAITRTGYASAASETAASAAARRNAENGARSACQVRGGTPGRMSSRPTGSRQSSSSFSSNWTATVQCRM